MKWYRVHTADPWFIQLTHDWGWLRRAWFVATWPCWYLWARLVGSVRQWLIKVIGGVTNEAWHNEALEWEGIARDYGDRLRELGDAEWIVKYRGW